MQTRDDFLSPTNLLKKGVNENAPLLPLILNQKTLPF